MMNFVMNDELLFVNHHELVYNLSIFNLSSIGVILGAVHFVPLVFEMKGI